MTGNNKLVSLYIRSCIVGFLAAVAFVGLIVWQDVAGIGHLVMSSPEGWLALVMLTVFNGIVFSGVQFGIRIMAMAEPEDKGPRGGKRDAISALDPIAIPVETRNRRSG